ncbi:hypothetical protein GCM10022259_23420 [Aquimarina mytili]
MFSASANSVSPGKLEFVEEFSASSEEQETRNTKSKMVEYKIGVFITLGVYDFITL